MIIRLDSFSKQILNFWYVSFYISLSDDCLLKFANSQHYPPAPFAKFIGSLMRF